MHGKVAELDMKDSCDNELELVVFEEPDFDGEIARVTLTNDYTDEPVNFYLSPKTAKEVRKALKPAAKYGKSEDAPTIGEYQFYFTSADDKACIFTIGGLAYNRERELIVCSKRTGDSDAIQTLKRADVELLHAELGKWLAGE